MTVIVAVANGGRVIMGGDSALTDDRSYQQLSMADGKVFLKKTATDEFVIGVAGSARAIQLMQHSFEPPKRPAKMGADKYMATMFINELRRAFKEAGHMKAEHGEESSEATALIGYRGDIWFFEGGDLQMERLRDEWAAAGAGSDVALGYLFATRSVGATKARVEQALKAACNYSSVCRPPFTFVTIEPKEKK